MKKLFPVFIFLLIPALIIPLQVTNAKKNKDTFHLDEVYPLGTDGRVELYSDDADVEIKGSDRSDVHVVVDYEARTSGIYWSSEDRPFSVEVFSEGDDLIIREVDRDVTTVGLVVNRRLTRYDILIEVPKEANLKIRGEDDDYDIRNVEGDISMHFEDGDAVIEGCRGNNFNFEVEDGSIEMEGGRGSLEVFLEDGYFSVSEGDFKEINAEAEDGELEIATTLNDEGSYHIECEDGEINLTILGGGGEFKVSYEDGRVKASGDFEIAEEDDDFSFYDLPGGNARVRIRMEDGRVRLTNR
ncbi:hypothetical protein CEE37_09390 [candidate division LCP-89 bacterium B3_LCP]|uniref:DUF4097 domain-containing protein n=1 Tax=candidate division LCP-89 bacterium B3_LCP TaxID=2012998 RepID=A0A532UYB1_UNCL8|nr:MAG: hypothetical protein CEE37_09390 [candidate division LCP-89 bacterium B3_LCP]